MTAAGEPTSSGRVRRGALLFSIAVLAVFAYAAYEMNTSFSTRARLFGNLIIIPALVLAIAQVVRELRRVRPMPVPPEVAFTPAAVAWSAGFFMSLAAIGLAATIPLFTFAYLRLAAHEAWPKAAAYAIVASLAIDLLFVRLLHVPLPAGAIVWPAIAN